MKISNSITTEDNKTITFDGELTGPQLDAVVRIGLEVLMMNGVIGMTKALDDKASNNS